MTPASAATALAALDIMERETERIEHLWKLPHSARKAFQANGFDTGPSETPIIPLLVRDDFKALKMTRILLDQGAFVNPVISLAVPKGSSLIRFSLMATDSFEQVDEAVDKMSTVAKKLGVFELATLEV